MNFLTRRTPDPRFVLGNFLAVGPHIMNVESLLRSHGLSIACGAVEPLIHVRIYVALGMRRLRMLIRKMTQPGGPLRESLLAVIARILWRITMRIFDMVVHGALMKGSLLTVRADVFTGGVLGIMSRHGEGVQV